MSDPPYYSPSRLRVYAECPRRYRFQVILQRPTRPSPHLDLGSNVHAALRDWLLLPARERTWEQLLECYRAAWRDNRPAFARRSRAELREWGERGIAMLRRYAATLPPDLEPLALEKNVRVDRGDLVLGGRVDRVDARPDGTLVVIDYKTGRFPRDPDRARADDLAAAIYARGSGALFLGAPVAAVEYLYLDGLERLTFTFEEPELEQRLDAVTALAREAEAATRADALPPRPGPACRWCDFLAECPEGRAFLDGPARRR